MGMVLVTLLFMLLVVAGMAVGVMFGRKPLTGSCGGVGKALAQEDYVCDICGGDESKCEEQQLASRSEEAPSEKAFSGRQSRANQLSTTEQPLAYEVTLNKDKNS